MHSFQASQLDRALCIHCNRPVLLHILPKCEACGLQNKECDFFGNPKNPKTMILCPTCTQKEQLANDLTIAKTSTFSAIDAHSPVQQERDTPHLQARKDFQKLITEPTSQSASALIEHAQLVDSMTRGNGDFFNARTVAFSELKQAIMSDETIGTIQERQWKYQEVISARVKHLGSVIFDADKVKHEAVVEMQVIKESLRDFGNSIRQEIRDRIKAADGTYTASPTVVKPPKLVKQAGKGTLEKMAEAYVMLHGGTIQNAIEEIRKIRGGKI